MKRVLLALIIIVSSLSFLPSPSQDVFAQDVSGGCSAVNGLNSSFVHAMATTSLTGQSFVQGDTLTFSGEIGDVDTVPAVLHVVISGPGGGLDQTAENISYTIPQSGLYDVSITNMHDSRTALLVAGCTPGTGGSGGGPGGEWEGYTDGRLNPDPLENYTVFCDFDNLYIYVIIGGDGTLAGAYSIFAIADIQIGNSIQFPDQASGGGEVLTVYRQSQDDIQVWGARGAKSFSLTECYTANGSGTPPPAPQPTTDPNDTDGDGVDNDLDACPDQYAPGMALGCPDTDGDGFVDAVDSCPIIAGVESANGCPDYDGDGVQDRFDWCPRYATPPDVPEYLGCPDVDEDQHVVSPRPREFVGSTADWCPLVAGRLGWYGCPEDPFQLIPVGSNGEPIPEGYTLFEYASQVGNFNDIIIDAQADPETECYVIYIGLICSEVPALN